MQAQITPTLIGVPLGVLLLPLVLAPNAAPPALSANEMASATTTPHRKFLCMVPPNGQARGSRAMAERGGRVPPVAALGARSMR
ncbi:MAG: hypothetical protein ACHQIG_06300 [Acidimicrobiia bacterium]